MAQLLGPQNNPKLVASGVSTPGAHEQEVISETQFEAGDWQQAAAQLARRLPEKVVLPSDDAYETARLGWNLRTRKSPDVIVFAEDPQDVCEALTFARLHNLSVVVQATGHRETVDGKGSILINTSRMKTLTINPRARTAWVGAGTKWGEVLAQAQTYGLAPLLGSSGDVGAVGYTLGGGMGWLARKYGMSVDSVLRLEVVTPDGRLRGASAEENPDLFWAMCGGGGGFGVVTAMEIRLFPITRVYAGNLYYPSNMAKEVFRRYRQWASDAPDELTCSIALMNFPPVPALPPILSGQPFVIVRGCYTGPAGAGETLLAYWRNWQAPMIDDFRERPFTEADAISQDPVDPLPALTSGEWIRDLSDETADALIRYTFPQGGRRCSRSTRYAWRAAPSLSSTRTPTPTRTATRGSSTTACHAAQHREGRAGQTAVSAAARGARPGPDRKGLYELHRGRRDARTHAGRLQREGLPALAGHQGSLRSR